MWHFQDSGAAEGPFDEQQVLDLIHSGSITRKTLVWTEGMGDWSAAEDTALAKHLRSIPPPIRKVAAAPPPIISTPPAALIANRTIPVGFRSPSPLANWLTAFLIASLVVGLVAIWSSSQQLDLLERIGRHGQFTMAEANATDTRQHLIGVIQLIIFITTAIVFGRWIYIVAHNVRVLGAQNLEFTPGWAVGYYFVPVMHLWKPYRAMKEIWQASRNPTDWQREKSSFILGLWWTFWIISCLIGQMSLRAAMSPQKLSDYSDAATFLVFSNIVEVPLCIFASLLVQTLSRRQLTTATNVGPSMPTQQPPPTPQKHSRRIRICIVAAVAIIGALILDHLEVAHPAPFHLYVARILGSAAVPFIVAVIPVALIRHWSGVLVGTGIICIMDYFVAQGILAR